MSYPGLGLFARVRAALVAEWRPFTQSNPDPDWAGTVSPEAYERDQEYIAYTYRARSDPWGGEGFPNAVEVDTIHYSPDHLKLCALLALRITNREEARERMGQKHSYSGRAFVGFRERLGEPWQLYPFGNELFFGYKTPESVVRAMRRTYFRDLKRTGDLVLDDAGDVVAEPYGANLGERAFWSCLLWQRGRRLPGLYTFQARYHRVGGDPRRFVEKEMKAVDYPPSLLQRFAP